MHRDAIRAVGILMSLTAENPTSKPILTGAPQQIIDELQAVEAAGIAEIWTMI